MFQVQYKHKYIFKKMVTLINHLSNLTNFILSLHLTRSQHTSFEGCSVPKLPKARTWQCPAKRSLFVEFCGTILSV